MTATHLTKGRLAEETALEHLLNHDLHLLCKNYYCKAGEIDLIMRNKSEIIFIEVRYRTQSNYGSAADSITRHKQLKIIRTAKHFLQKNNLLYHSYSRFDVIAIDYKNASIQLDWIKNAFYAD